MQFLRQGRKVCVRQTFFKQAHRRLHLAPPFLVDDYTPRFRSLSTIEASKKRSAAYAHLRKCNLCPRLCGVNRYEKTGYCLIGAETVKVNVVAPHFGEGKYLLQYPSCRNFFLRIGRTLYTRSLWIWFGILLWLQPEMCVLSEP